MFDIRTYSSVKYTVFTLTREVRGRSVPELSTYLRAQLDAQEETFAGNPNLRLHQQNYRQVRHILARLTHWVDSECGLVAHFDDLVSQGRSRPFEIEHIWANQYDRFAELYAHPADFDQERNRIGGLLLLQRGLNQSLGDATYEDKRDAYVAHGQNLLARSLHPLAYQNNPAFSQLRQRAGLRFRSYDEYGPDEQRERQELYIRIAEWVWNPSRLDLDGVKPPTPIPIGASAEGGDTSGDWSTASREAARQRYWEALLSVAASRSEMHAHISPTRFHWLGTQRGPYKWNYIVGRDVTRVEMYIGGGTQAENKALFDALDDQKREIEAAFGGPLEWQRLDDRIGSRIACSFSDGGWGDEAEWPRIIDRAVDAMGRLFDAIGPLVYPEGDDDDDDDGAPEPLRYDIRRRFWAALLAAAAERTTLHRNISPSPDNWVASSAGLGGVAGLNYVVRTSEAQVELYLDTRELARNKALFDRLYAQRQQIEMAFGAALDWQRLDGRRGCRIRWVTESGGWRDELTWTALHDELIDAMIRLDSALRSRLLETLGME